MTTELYNTWSEFRAAFDQVLAGARHSLVIFDDDLAQLRLNQSERMAELQRLLTGNPSARVRIALKKTDHLHSDHPRLIQLLKHHGHLIQLRQVPVSLHPLRDSLIIADEAHMLVRFDLEHPRSKRVLDDKAETAPYLERFEAIWTEGAADFSPTTFGL
jgi:hypothetical protein